MANKNKVIRKTIECIEYLSVEAPLRKVDYLKISRANISMSM